ncbi:hypothetical protein DNTS_014016 [Danionella cerebrum]|uniref:Uncharacterized protein n=1 Tax=Danionella cerebrum TaxID=2873325 RepID=A0A553N5C9_9TELE|nr:hypothetical protein DNTS_014016 [Danionella translucida]
MSSDEQIVQVHCLGKETGLSELVLTKQTLSGHRKLSAAVKGSAKGAAASGGGAFLGGMIGGPIGIMFGGTLGGLLGSWMSRGQFKPLGKIIMELPTKQKETLCSDVTAVLGSLHWTDVAGLIALVMGSTTLQEQVLAAILTFTSRELNAEVQFKTRDVTMASRKGDVMKLCCEISGNKGIKVAFKNSMKGASVSCGGAFVGGLLGGPLGIAVGGAVGGALGAWMTSGQFTPLPEILMELTPMQQDKLYSDIMDIVGSLRWTDFAQLFAQVNGDASVHDQVLGAIIGFAQKQLKAEVTYKD